jgi:hypothetical protein
MSLTAFLERLEKHGERLAAWPEADRKAAELLLLESEAARVALAEMQVVRDALQNPATKAPGHLTDRIMRAVSGHIMTGTSHDMLAGGTEHHRS